MDDYWYEVYGGVVKGVVATQRLRARPARDDLAMVGNHITRVISGSGNYRKFPVITRADFWLPGNDPWGGRLKI